MESGRSFSPPSSSTSFMNYNPYPNKHRLVPIPPPWGMLNYRLLIVYQRAVEYDDIANSLLPQLRRFDRSLASHLMRSGNSMLTAIAEGASADQPKMKAGSYRNAKREAEECGIGWEKSARRKWTPYQKTMQAVSKLDEIAKMLAKLIMRFDPPS